MYFRTILFCVYPGLGIFWFILVLDLFNMPFYEFHRVLFQLNISMILTFQYPWDFFFLILLSSKWWNRKMGWRILNCVCSCNSNCFSKLYLLNLGDRLTWLFNICYVGKILTHVTWYVVSCSEPIYNMH